jgi:Cellulase (glycosyl hydrolase family 5)
VRTECKLSVALVLASLFFWSFRALAVAADGSDPPAKPAEKSPFQINLKSDGTFALNYHGVQLVTMEFKAWAANWKWANPTPSLGAFQEGKAQYDLRIPGLAAEAAGTVEWKSPEVITYDLSIKHSATKPGVMGACAEFNLDLKSPLFNGQAPPDPTLIPDNAGWEWSLGSGRGIKVTLEPGVKKLYFEQNRKNRIRAFFLGEETANGIDKLRITVTLPQGTERKPTEEQVYGPVGKGWLANALPYGLSPVDLSTLNHQPGAHGFLRTSGERLVFEDGTPARFWGIDVMAFALFSNNAEIERHAKRLAMLGFNLVRLHHHDTMGWVDPTVINKHAPGSRMLDEHGIDRLDYWIKCLKENGIYVWLDMHSYRMFREADRSTELGEVTTFNDFNNDKRAQHQVKGYCQYDPVLQKLMAEFQEKYLTHVNRYTGVAYKDDPTIAFCLVTNENDITHHYGILAIPREKHPALTELYQQRLKTFSQKSGLSENDMRFPWSAGPSKMFLNDQEHAFYSTMIDSIRGTGSKALIAAGQMWGDNPLSCLPSITTGDVIDVHEYDVAGQLTTDPRYKPNIVSMIGINQVSGKPLTVSEWNLEMGLEPTVDRFIAPMYVASIAALQGWDALMLYGYCQQPLSEQPHITSVWDAFSDPATMTSMPTAAMIFRNGHVSPAKKEYCLALSRDQMFNPNLRPESCAAARTLMEQSKFTIGIPPTPELDWLKPSKPPESAKLIHEPDEGFLPSNGSAVVSDTGELRRDWDAGIQTIDTPKTQVAQGAIGDHQFKLGDVTILSQTRHAAIAVSALDDQPIRSSNLILVTTVARVLKPKRIPGRAGWGQDMSSYSEAVRGDITVRAPAGLKAFRLLGDGSTLPLEDVVYQDGTYRLPLQKKVSLWYLLQKPQTP